jgi:hypothetical protein
MPVFRAIQRFSMQGSNGRLAPGQEVHHLALDARGVGDDAQHDQRKNDQPRSRAFMSDT